MRASQLVLAAVLGGTGIVALGAASPARAQSSTTGAIQGQVTDAESGDRLAGVTVVVTTGALPGTHTAITDEQGFYKIGDLPPGLYLVTFYYERLTVQRSDINVGVNKTTPVFQRLALGRQGGELLKVSAIAPAIDPTSTARGITIDRNYLRNVPVPGRTFTSALDAAAGSLDDGVGVSLSGSTSLENQYFVDGLNTTGLTYGAVGSPVFNDFIEEIEVITGGYNAEYGRATGGVVNVVTKTGTNELRGSVFGSVQPSLLTAPAEPTPVNASSIDAVANSAYKADLGFELGGPIVRDKLWFFVGVAPQLERTDITRTTKRQIDCRTLLPSGQLSGCDPRLEGDGGYADGLPDVDPATGFFLTNTLDEEVRSNRSSTYNLVGKLNFAATPRNQAQLTFHALPRFARTPGIYGLAGNGTRSEQLTSDLSAKWTAKLDDDATQIEAVVGWHRDRFETHAIDPALQDAPLQALTNGSLGVWGPGFGAESAATNAGCFDSDQAELDAYPYLATNCPMSTRYYSVGGPGKLARDTEQRRSATLAVTHRAKALGHHELKAGLELESALHDKARRYSGGAYIQNFVREGDVRVTRWVELRGRYGSQQANANTDPRFDDRCRTPDLTGLEDSAEVEFLCDYLAGTLGSPGTQIRGNTFNWSAYLRDSWQILPNLVVNLGIRYEEQRLRYASFLQDTVDPLSEEALGENALVLQNLWAPRVGAIYDWTEEGRAKAYAHWGRFYESIPMDINDRSFGGEVQFVQDFASNGSLCGAADPRIGGYDGMNCLASSSAHADREQLLGASGTLIAPGIQPQYLDELVVGVDHEILEDLTVGASLHHRVLGRVIEDVSTDGANTYVIANPGEWSAAEEQALLARRERTDDPVARARLDRQIQLFRGIRELDKPRRDYNALQLTVTRRFSRRLYLQGSYTYARVSGNYPGLVSYDNGQIDPNISSQYDLVELLANRQGPLPQDRPHSLKLDGYYTFDLHAHGALTVGGRFRMSSGAPANVLGAHYIYGPNESFLLPRGALDRIGLDHGLDLHVEYGRRIGTGMSLALYVDVFNVYDHQGTASLDNTYAPPVSLSGQIQNANPVSGGSYEDLIWLKQVNAQGQEQPTPIGRNPNFRNTATRHAPAYGRIGVRLTF